MNRRRRVYHGSCTRIQHVFASYILLDREPREKLVSRFEQDATGGAAQRSRSLTQDKTLRGQVFRCPSTVRHTVSKSNVYISSSKLTLCLCGLASLRFKSKVKNARRPKHRRASAIAALAIIAQHSGNTCIAAFVNRSGS